MTGLFQYCCSVAKGFVGHTVAQASVGAQTFAQCYYVLARLLLGGCYVVDRQLLGCFGWLLAVCLGVEVCCYGITRLLWCCRWFQDVAT